ncbi:MAG: carboxypeptidase regulatory-like domain-containing protein, partial [Acidobacteria bacterium]|nr:carboxypeptidase regulatory-like domain-containing protein [Acidobacteriota bacterium]
MRQVRKASLCLALTLCVSAVLAQPMFAQTVTSGTLTGVVMDQQKAVLPGATVTAVHVPTGTTYETVTQADGRFTVLSVRVGGPYTVTAAMSGFKTEAQQSIVVGLGESRDVQFILQIQAVTETVTVTATAQVIDTSRAGTAAN